MYAVNRRHQRCCLKSNHSILCSQTFWEACSVFAYLHMRSEALGSLGEPCSGKRASQDNSFASISTFTYRSIECSSLHLYKSGGNPLPSPGYPCCRACETIHQVEAVRIVLRDCQKRHQLGTHIPSCLFGTCLCTLQHISCMFSTVPRLSCHLESPGRERFRYYVRPVTSIDQLRCRKHERYTQKQDSTEQALPRSMKSLAKSISFAVYLQAVSNSENPFKTKYSTFLRM